MVFPINATPEGGYVMNAAKLGNALQRQVLENRMKELENQFYAPNTQSQIDYRNSITQGQNIDNKFAPDKLRLANEHAGLVNKFYEPNILSEIANRNALTSRYNTMTPLEAKELEQKNAFYPELTRAQINANNSLAKFREMGGGIGSKGSQDYNIFKNSVAADNPHLKPDQIREAANAVAEGRTTLADGTPINPLSFESRQALDRSIRSTTTAPILTGNIRANQAEAEIGELNRFAQEGLKNYGDTTFFNMSPQQIADTFKKDDKSQERLGKFIASQALQYEIAQNRIRLANGQPGVHSTEELMKLSGQTVNARYPNLSYKARKEASDYLDKALLAGLKARQNVPIGASQTRGSSNSASQKDPSQMTTEEILSELNSYGK